MRIVARCAILLLLVSVPLHAQRETAVPGVLVSGTVVDQTGAVLPTAAIELHNLGGATLQSTTTTDVGTFEFRNVPPGRYDVVATFSGFQATTARVTVGNRPPSAVRIQMPLATITQEVTVGDSSADVRADARSNIDSNVIDEQALANLPVFNDDVVGTMSRFLDASAIGTNGVMLIVNGVEVNSLTLPAAAIQQIKINQDPYAPEFRQPGRGRIEIVTKPGSQTYSGTANVTFRDATLNARNYFAVTKPPEQRRIAEGFLGGPVRRSENTGFTLSVKDDSEDTQSLVVARDLSGLVQENIANPYHRGLVSSTLTHQQGKNNTIVLTASFERETQRNQNIGGVSLPSAGLNWSSIEQDTIYNHMTVVTPTLLNQVRLLVGHEYESWDGISQAQKIIVLDAFTGGGSQQDRSRTEHHFTLTDIMSWTRGAHAMKVGFQIPDWSRRRFDDNSNRAGTFYFSSLADYAANHPYSFIQQAGSGHVVFLEKVLGAFAQDEIKLRPNLSVVAGVRYDWQNYFDDHNNVSPRGSIAWSPLESGRLVIRSGAGLFFDRSGPNPIQDILKYNGTNLVRYTVTDPGYPSPFAAGAPLSAAAPGIVVFEPGIVLPSLLQYSVSVERELRKGTSASVTYTRSRGYDQFRSRDINAPLPPTYGSRPDPRYAVVREIESESQYRSNSIQVSVKGRLAPRFAGSIQYTLGKAMTDTAGVNWMPPNSYDVSGEYARSDNDQRHRLYVIGTFNAESWFNAGVSLAFESGRPYTMTTGHDDFNTGTANARPAGVPRNSLDGPGYADLDLRWSRTFPLRSGDAKSGPAAVVGIDAFNVFNRVNYSRYIGTLTSPFFGQAISAQAPRQIQLSVRVKF